MVALASSIQSGPGTYALLLGSGVSRSAGIPTGRDVVKILVQRVADAEGADAGEDPIGWFRRRFGEDPGYSSLVGGLGRSSGDRVNLLRPMFEQTDNDREDGLKLPSPAHLAVARLVAKGYVKVIVTTNFDRLLEQALREQGVQPTVITDEGTAENALPLRHSPITIIKINGDYLSPNFKNTLEELDAYGGKIADLLREVFAEYGLVVCGWSAEHDTALRTVLTEADPAPFASFWLQKGEIETGSEAEGLVSHRKANKVKIEDAGDTLEGIEATVEALADAAGQSIVNAEVAVARLKRFLPDETHRIRLHDLVIGETDKAIAQFEKIESAGHMRSPQIDIDKTLKYYEDATETLLRLLVVGSRFSDRSDHDALWAERADRLANRNMHLSSGDSYATRAQFYPVLLALYAIGLGCAVADRMGPIIHTLMTVEIKRSLPHRSNRETLPLLAATESLHIDKFPASVERENPTPRSDHVFEVLRPVVADVISNSERLEDFFDEIEYFLGFVSTYQLRFQEPSFLIPVGRAVRRETREGIYPDGLTKRHESSFPFGSFFMHSTSEDVHNRYHYEIERLRGFIAERQFSI